MKLQKISIEGFRGIRDPLELELPSGFVVICGPNGSGKSTICDAIEFALTGGIRRGLSMREKGESFDNYIWWRGSGSPVNRSVKLFIGNNTSHTLNIIRSDSFAEAVDDLNELIIPELAPSDAIAQLIRTSLIRDEYITQFSVDLQERERFDFAKSAIGRIDFDKVSQRAKELFTYAAGQVDLLESEYKKYRDRVSELTARLSELQGRTSVTRNVEEAHKLIESSLGSEIPSETELLRLASSKLLESRLALTRLESLAETLEELVRLQTSLESEKYNIRSLQDLETKVEKARVNVISLSERVSTVSVELSNQQKYEPLMRSLAELAAFGKEIGRQSGHCPLCGSEVSEETYELHLNEIKKQIDAASSTLNKLVKERSDATTQLTHQEAILRALELEIKRVGALREDFSKHAASMQKSGRELGLKLSEDLTEARKQVVDLSNRERKLQIDLENAITTLQLSGTSSEIIEVESQIGHAKSESDKISQRLAAAEQIQEKAKAATNAIERVSGEIVDEQLSAISPLLAEIFARLKPHIDWREISYRMRGDVRRFLSLTVGDELNPTFVFSSGQRRAVGLAFLLTVYLARPWVRLRTLVLDDPVQHIDDYRALHLTEVLAAIRKMDHQIICTVEDSALAELLCRRLRSTFKDPGLLVQLEYSSHNGVRIKQKHTIRPLMRRMLVAS